MTHRCREKGCRKHFSVRSNSVMQSSKLGYQTWAVAIYLLTTSLKGVSSMKLHRDLGITQKSAWHLAHRLRMTWAKTPGAVEPPPSKGSVEVDEAYFGGKRKNMSNAKRKALKDAGVGRGSVGKTAVVGVRNRATGEVDAAVAERTDGATLKGFVLAHSREGETVYTDESAAYEGLPVRESVRHSTSEYVRGQAHTNGIESFWAMMKRGYVGTYHKMSPEHLGRYVDEFAGRHNMRPLDTSEQMALVARGLLFKRLQYKELIGNGEREPAIAV